MPSSRRRVEVALPPGLEAPLTGRRVARDVAGDLSARSQDEIALVVSELVTNAVVYGRAPVVLVVELGDDEVEIEVRDSDPAMHEATDESRGILIVEALTTGFGVRCEAGGAKSVWAVVPIRA